MHQLPLVASRWGLKPQLPDEREVARILLDRIEPPDGRLEKMIWPEHPVFGKMTPNAWSVFAYRHMDHHLRQFGI